MSNNTAPVLKRRSSDIKGFWDHEQGPLYFKPMTAKVFDGQKKIDNRKPTILIIGECLGPVKCKDKDGNVKELQKGDIVGLWGKPGMRDIRGSKGVAVMLKYTGEKDIGKAKPMKTFDVYSADGGTPLQIEQDSRVYSASVDTWLSISPNCEVIRPKLETAPARNAGYTPNLDADDDDDEVDGIPLDENGKPIF
jgi:hypothetical protein